MFRIEIKMNGNIIFSRSLAASTIAIISASAAIAGSPITPSSANRHRLFQMHGRADISALQLANHFVPGLQLPIREPRLWRGIGLCKGNKLQRYLKRRIRTCWLCIQQYLYGLRHCRHHKQLDTNAINLIWSWRRIHDHRPFTNSRTDRKIRTPRNHGQRDNNKHWTKLALLKIPNDRILNGRFLLESTRFHLKEHIQARRNRYRPKNG